MKKKLEHLQRWTTLPPNEYDINIPQSQKNLLLQLNFSGIFFLSLLTLVFLLMGEGKAAYLEFTFLSVTTFSFNPLT